MEEHLMLKLEKGYEVTTVDDVKFKKYDQQNYTMEKNNDKQIVLITRDQLLDHLFSLPKLTLTASKITNMGLQIPGYDDYFDRLACGQTINLSYQGHIMTFKKSPEYVFTEEHTKEPKWKKTNVLNREDIEKLFKKYEKSIHTVRYLD